MDLENATLGDIAANLKQRAAQDKASRMAANLSRDGVSFSWPDDLATISALLDQLAKERDPSYVCYPMILTTQRPVIVQGIAVHMQAGGGMAVTKL